MVFYQAFYVLVLSLGAFGISLSSCVQPHTRTRMEERRGERDLRGAAASATPRRVLHQARTPAALSAGRDARVSRSSLFLYRLMYVCMSCSCNALRESSGPAISLRPLCVLAAFLFLRRSWQRLRKNMSGTKSRRLFTQCKCSRFPRAKSDHFLAEQVETAAQPH